MGNEHSSRASRSSNASGNDSTKGSGSGVSASFSFLSMKKAEPTYRSQIVVVNAAGEPIGDPKDDIDLKKIKETQRFLPVLKGCLPGYRDGPDIYNKIGSKHIAKFTHRFQAHLAICSQVVSKEQSVVFSKIVQLDQSMTTVSNRLGQNARQFDRLCEQLSKVRELQGKLETVDLLLMDIITGVQTLNELLPEADKLPPMSLAPRSSYSSIGNSTSTTPLAPMTATGSPVTTKKSLEDGNDDDDA